MQRTSPYAANQGQGQGTPKITALPSTLGSRAAPTLPSASTTYEPLLKPVLGQRFAQQVLGVSLCAVCTISVLWASWDAGSVGSLSVLSFVKNAFSPSAIALTLVWGLGAVVPVAILRKRHVQG